MLRKIPLILAAAASLGTTPAAPSLGLQATSYVVSPVDSFTIVLVLNNPETLTVAGFNLSVSASAGEAFVMDSRTYPTVVNDPNSALALPGLSITGGNSADLGATSDFQSGIAGSAVIATYTFRVSSMAPPGDHTLVFRGPGAGEVPTVSDISFNDYDTPAQLVAGISVVPEPATLASVLAGTILFLRRRA